MPIVINGTGTVTGISVGGLPDGCVDKDTLATTTRPAFVSYALLSDEKAANTAAGQATPGQYTNFLSRDLTTEVADADGIILGLNGKATSGNLKVNGTNYSVATSADEFALGAGTYYITWKLPGRNIDNFRSRIYNVTDSSAISPESSNAYCSGNTNDNWTYGRVRFTLSGTKNLRFESKQSNTSSSTSDYGVLHNSGSAEQYSQAEIYKEAS